MNAPYDSLVEAYLDGTLRGEELRRFEARMRSDDALRNEVELARRIEASLRERFEAETIPFELNGSAGGAHATTAPDSSGGSLSWRRVGLIAGIAAGVLLAAALVLRFSSTIGGGHAIESGTQLERLYAKYRSEGWEPAWVCEDDAEFIGAVADRLGQGLLIDDTDTGGPGLTVLGWAYGEDVSSYEVIVTDKTMVLLAKVGGRGVIALVDRADRESRRLRVPEGELTLHRREVGELVIYELTPLDRAHLLGRFFVP